MSHSTDNRRENKEAALRMMAEATVDEMILTTIFRPPEYPEIVLTTWTELQNEYLIEEANRKGPIEYRLTGAGWIAGLRVSGLWNNPHFREKAGKLSEALKGHIKGRAGEALVTFRQVCEESELYEVFVYNAIESHLLRWLYRSYDAAWYPSGKSYIVVPPTFGLTLL